MLARLLFAHTPFSVTPTFSLDCLRMKASGGSISAVGKSPHSFRARTRLPSSRCSQGFPPPSSSSIDDTQKARLGYPCKAVNGGFLLKLPFTTIFEYLQIIQVVATSMNCLRRHGMFYLAAAVSDFYVPWESMAKHKIESAAGPLDMRLSQVPKMLPILRTEWAPSALCVSFKLETNPEILLEKAESALRKYQMHVVVANELATYKREVILVTLDEKINIRKQSEDADVEEQLIKLLAEKHCKYIECSGMD